jgi:hypothetical protein
MSHQAKKQSKSASRTNSLEQAQALIQQVTAKLGPAPNLTVKTRKGSAKLPKGGAEIVKTIASLSEEFGLKVPTYSAAKMTASAAKAESLAPLYSQLVSATQQVADQMFSANSESWEAASAHYSVLRRLSQNNGALQKKLAPVQKFFKSRGRHAAKDSGSSTAPATTSGSPTAPATTSGSPTAPATTSGSPTAPAAATGMNVHSGTAAPAPTSPAPATTTPS